MRQVLREMAELCRSALDNHIDDRMARSYLTKVLTKIDERLVCDCCVNKCCVISSVALLEKVRILMKVTMIMIWKKNPK